jgi:hypothetical protein
MGICNSEPRRERSNSVSNSLRNSQAKPSPNPHSIISGQVNKTIVKQINDIKGDMVQIDNCSYSSIIIMDYSAQVIIEKCNNCVIFIAPCTSS